MELIVLILSTATGQADAEGPEDYVGLVPWTRRFASECRNDRDITVSAMRSHVEVSDFGLALLGSGVSKSELKSWYQ